MKQYRIALLAIAAVIYGLYPSVLPAQDAPPASGQTIHVVAEGDSVESLAQRFLGSKEAASELRALNRLGADEQVPAGLPLVIPGAERAQALAALEATEQAMKIAVDAKAGDYAIDDFKKATQLFSSGEKARKQASYLRASALAEMATQVFGQCVEKANVAAAEVRSAKLSAKLGRVELSGDEGKSWGAIEKGGVLNAGALLRTGGRSQAEIQLADKSSVLVQPGSIVGIDELIQDKRTKGFRQTLRIVLGEAMLSVPAKRSSDSQLTVRVADAQVEVRGALTRIGVDAEGQMRVAALNGPLIVEKNGTRTQVEPGQGSVGRSGKPMGVAQALPAAPQMLYPDGDVGETGAQSLNFSWKPVAGAAAYRVEIALDPRFANVVSLVNLPGTKVGTPVMDEGLYYYRVSSVTDKQVQGPYTPVGRFTIKRRLGLTLKTTGQAVERDGVMIVGLGERFLATAAEADSSVVSVAYRLDEGEFMVLPDGLEIRQGGEYLVSARAIGADGKEGPEVRMEVRVDATAPELRLHVGELIDFPGKGWVRTLSGLVDDDTRMGDMEYQLDDAPYQPYTVPIKIDTHRNHRFRLRARDVFGNLAETGIVVEGSKGKKPSDEKESKSSKGFRLF